MLNSAEKFVAHVSASRSLYSTQFSCSYLLHLRTTRTARSCARYYPPITPELPTLIENMYETMEKSDGVGLAAPQVGLSIRLLVVGLDVLSEDYPEYAGFKRAYLNAHIVETEEETVSMEEGCLSLPGINEPVRRPKRVRVQWMDPDFTQHDEMGRWIPGACFAHEIDHLDGKLFIDSISPLRRQLIKKKLSNLLSGKFSCRYKVKTKLRIAE